MISFTLTPSRKHKDQAFIKASVYYKNSQINFSTGLRIESKCWDKKNKRVIPKTDPVNKSLQTIEFLIPPIIDYLINHGLPLTGQFITEELDRRKGLIERRSIYFLPYFWEYVEDLKARNQVNYKQYLTTYNHLKDFIKNPKLSFEEVNVVFMDDFTHYLKQRGYKPNTVATRIKNVKAVLSYAFKRSLHFNQSFIHFQARTEQPDTIYLTVDELGKLMTISNLTDHQQNCLNWFLIGCFTGLRFEDWDKLDLNMEKNGIVSFIQSKTEDNAHIIVSEELKVIFGRIKGDKPLNQVINRTIKEVVKLAGIKEEIEVIEKKGYETKRVRYKKYQLVSTHTARRTFATNSILSGVPKHVVMLQTGHKTEAAFNRYIRLTMIDKKMMLEKFYSIKKGVAV